MAPLPDAPRCVSLDAHFTIGDDTHVMSRLHFQFSGTPVQADRSSLASLAASQWSVAGGLNAMMANDRSLTSFVVTSLDDPTATQGVWTGTTVGTLSSSAGLPADASVVVAYAIARRYRGGHPRGYWPLLGNAQQASPQSFRTDSVADLQARFRSWVNALTAATYTGGTLQQVNISYYQGSTWHQKPNGNWVRIATRRTTPIIEPVLAQNVRTHIGTQRRRLR